MRASCIDLRSLHLNYERVYNDGAKVVLKKPLFVWGMGSTDTAAAGEDCIFLITYIYASVVPTIRNAQAAAVVAA